MTHARLTFRADSDLSQLVIFAMQREDERESPDGRRGRAEFQSISNVSLPHSCTHPAASGASAHRRTRDARGCIRATTRRVATPRVATAAERPYNVEKVSPNVGAATDV